MALQGNHTPLRATWFPSTPPRPPSMARHGNHTYPCNPWFPHNPPRQHSKAHHGNQHPPRAPWFPHTTLRHTSMAPHGNQPPPRTLWFPHTPPRQHSKAHHGNQVWREGRAASSERVVGSVGLGSQSPGRLRCPPFRRTPVRRNCQPPPLPLLHTPSRNLLPKVEG